jgi:carbon storage regulator
MSGLVLSRFPGERIIIGQDITVEVAEVRGNKVRLKVVAPKGVSVHREEVAKKIEEKARSAKVQSASEGPGQPKPATGPCEVASTSEA